MLEDLLSGGAPAIGGPHETEAAIALDRISWGPPGRTLFSELSLTVAAGESVAIMGPSGSGKTSILSLCLALIRPHEGSITVAGHQLGNLRGRRLAQVRSRSLGMVYQFGELLPELSARDNVALPAMWTGVARSVARERALALLAQVGIAERSDAMAGDLSGGERQRVAVARALVNSPQVILADEPTGSLDEDARTTVSDLLFSLPRSTSCALVVATHDRWVASHADRVMRLDEGRLIEVA